MRLLATLLSLLACALVGCGSPGGGSKQPSRSISFFAAASTKEASEQIAKDFEGATGMHVEVALGPSSGLAKQIEQGASADLFLSADQVSADYLSKKDLVLGRRDLLSNKLVVIVPTDSEIAVKELSDLANPRIRRLALAEPKVPAGEYARQALKKAGVWEKVENRVVGGIDVRATLQFVARGEADAGLVYRTDALDRPSVQVAADVDERLHEPILYPLVLLRREVPADAARRFYDYLASEKAADVFRHAGFGVAR